MFVLLKKTTMELMPLNFKLAFIKQDERRKRTLYGKQLLTCKFGTYAMQTRY